MQDRLLQFARLNPSLFPSSRRSSAGLLCEAAAGHKLPPSPQHRTSYICALHTSSSSFLCFSHAAPHATRPIELVLPRALLGAGCRTLRLRGGLGPSCARRSYASASGAAAGRTGEEA